MTLMVPIMSAAFDIAAYVARLSSALRCDADKVTTGHNGRLHCYDCSRWLLRLRRMEVRYYDPQQNAHH